jgi:hypothetical protein
MDHLKIGVVDALRARAAAVVAANPHAAKRILGWAPAKPAPKKAAPKPRKPRADVPSRNPHGRPPVHPWRTIEVGEHFDILGDRTRRSVVKQAGDVGREVGRKFAVALVVLGRSSVIRVTRVG